MRICRTANVFSAISAAFRTMCSNLRKLFISGWIRSRFHAESKFRRRHRLVASSQDARDGLGDFINDDRFEAKGDENLCSCNVLSLEYWLSVEGS